MLKALTLLLLAFQGTYADLNRDLARATALLNVISDRAHKDVAERSRASDDLVALKADSLVPRLLEEALRERVPGIGLELTAAAGRQPSGARLALDILRRRKLLWWQRTRLICFRPRRTLTTDELVLLKALAQDKDRRVKLELLRDLGVLKRADKDRMWEVLQKDKDLVVRQEAAKVLGHR